MATNTNVNKVVYGVKTLIDISDSTVSETSLAKGKTAYDASGKKITGTASITYDASQEMLVFSGFAEDAITYDAKTQTLEFKE